MLTCLTPEPARTFNPFYCPQLEVLGAVRRRTKLGLQ